MKVFISWSGEPSRSVASALRKWLPDVMQFVEPFMSAADIGAGARWSEVLTQELNAYAFGVVCVTAGNQSTPWINFEAGALAKAIANESDPRVCPYLLGLPESQLKGPLTRFQAKQANESGTLDLVRAINQAAGTQALSSEALDRAFQTWWPRLKQKLDATPLHIDAKRTLDDMTEEILALTREVSIMQTHRHRSGVSEDEAALALWRRLAAKHRRDEFPPEFLGHWNRTQGLLDGLWKGEIEPGSQLLKNLGESSYRSLFRIRGRDVSVTIDIFEDIPSTAAEKLQRSIRDAIEKTLTGQRTSQPTKLYEVTFRLSAARDTVGAVQFVVRYNSTVGTFAGVGASARYTTKPSGALVALNHEVDTDRLTVGVITVAGLCPPTDLVTCIFHGRVQPQPTGDDFTIEVEDATGPDGKPTSVDVEVSVTVPE